MTDVEKQVQGMSPKERQDFLSTHAATVEEGDYFKSYTADEILSKRESMTDDMILLHRKETEFEDMKAQMKAPIKDLKSKINSTRDKIAQKGEWAKGKLYLFDDQEKGMMEYYDSTGQLVSSRRLKPEERQMNVMSIARTGTNG